MRLNKIQINVTFSIISQHTQRGLSSLRSKRPFCGTGSGASPPTPPKTAEQKNHRFSSFAVTNQKQKQGFIK